MVEIDDLLCHAVESRVSDVHLKVGRPPMWRRKGTVEPIEGWESLTEADLGAILERVCEVSPARLESFRETGELDIAYARAGKFRFRVNGFRQRGTVAFAFRRIPRDIPSFDELHLPAGVRRLAEERHGLVIVTGATGSGKSTTLAAVVDHINRTRRSHVVSIEDPIEFLHRDQLSIVNQREVGIDTASFGVALRQALRQDPDIILIGELRDAVSAETALQAAESGHLVLTTMHTVDAAETVGRMIEFFPAAKQVAIRSIMAGVLRGVVSQRLLPRVGEGLVAAVEVMLTNARVAEMIRESRSESIPEAIAEGAFHDMQSFEQALIALVLGGDVDREVAANSATNRHDFTLALEQALKRQAAPAPEPEPEENDEDAKEPDVPFLRLARDSSN